MSAGVWELHSLGWVERLAGYTAKVNPITKVLDFVQFGGAQDPNRVRMGWNRAELPEWRRRVLTLELWWK